MPAVTGKYARNMERRNRDTNAYIDYSLFSSSGKNAIGSTKRRGDSRGEYEKPPATVVMGAHELWSMQAAATIMSPEQMATQKKQREAETNARLSKGIERKNRMTRMEKEKSKRAPVLNEFEVRQREKQNEILATAKTKLDEELDDVKHMNKMVAYAQCVTIRDAQLHQKSIMERNLAEQDRREDLAMEVERVRAIKLQNERQARRAEEQRRGALVIVDQIKQREAERMRQARLQEIEARQIIENQKALERAEEQERLAKLEAGRLLMEEVAQENHKQAKAKLLERQKEILEDKKIAEYIKQKEAREAAEEEEKERIAMLKELELAKMREVKMKSDNKQAQIDGLRAKRYQEAKDRAWRQQQLENAKKQAQMKAEVAASREKQKADRAYHQQQQAIREREEYRRVLEWQDKQRKAEEVVEAQKKAIRYQNRQDLYNQIEANEREKRAAREMFKAEGEEIRRAQELEHTKLARIKELKLTKLRASGVPEKYTAELAKKKCLVSGIH